MSIKPGEGNYWKDRRNEVLVSKLFSGLPTVIQGKSLYDMIQLKSRNGTVVGPDQIIKPFAKARERPKQKHRKHY
jgi:hypothetical protein